MVFQHDSKIYSFVAPCSILLPSWTSGQFSSIINMSQVKLHYYKMHTSSDHVVQSKSWHFKVDNDPLEDHIEEIFI